MVNGRRAIKWIPQKSNKMKKVTKIKEGHIRLFYIGLDRKF